MNGLVQKVEQRNSEAPARKANRAKLRDDNGTRVAPGRASFVAAVTSLELLNLANGWWSLTAPVEFRLQGENDTVFDRKGKPTVGVNINICFEFSFLLFGWHRLDLVVDWSESCTS